MQEQRARQRVRQAARLAIFDYNNCPVLTLIHLETRIPSLQQRGRTMSKRIPVSGDQWKALREMVEVFPQVRTKLLHWTEDERPLRTEARFLIVEADIFDQPVRRLFRITPREIDHRCAPLGAVFGDGNVGRDLALQRLNSRCSSPDADGVDRT